MKAERRHELQTNSLAQFLSDLPLYIRFHGNKILIGVIVVCLLVLLIRYRMSTAEQARQMTIGSLTSARSGIEQLKLVDRMQSADPAGRVKQRIDLSRQVATAIDQILQSTSDPDDAAVRAEAYVARGDLNWSLANLPEVPGAATQPSLAMPNPPEQYLKQAEDAYQQVLGAYPNQRMAKISALLGLAAIEENRGNWDRATEIYNRMLKDDAISRQFKEMARVRLSIMPQLRTPVYLGSFSSTQPATAPAAATTATLPATQPQ